LKISILVKVFFVSVVSLLLSCSQSTQNQTPKTPQKGISNEEAILQAEQFIIQQGYTDSSPKTKQLKFEKGEFASDTSKIISYRNQQRK